MSSDTYISGHFPHPPDGRQKWVVYLSEKGDTELAWALRDQLRANWAAARMALFD
jgi:hypothetical protein